MEELIIAGRITVNRMPADVGQKVGPGDEVRINGEPVKIRFAEPRPRVLLYHKPTGELVTRDDPEDRPTVFDDLPSIRDGKWIAIGRLDYNTEGLLVFTNSGELANRMMHPRYEVEREYAVRVMGRLTDEQRQALLNGVELEDGLAKCSAVEDGGGDEDSANHWYNVALKEGRNREVRRLFEALGLAVSRLIRVRYGRIAMPSSLKRGDVMEMDPQDVNALLRSIGLKPNAAGAQDNEDAQPPQQRGPRQHAGPAPGKGQRPGQRNRRRGPQGGFAPGNQQRQAPAPANREGNWSGPSTGSQEANGNTMGDAQPQRDPQGQPRHGNRPPHGNAQRSGPGGGHRASQPQGKPERRGPRPGQGQGQGNSQGNSHGNSQGHAQGNGPGGGQRRPPRHASGNGPGAGAHSQRRPGKPKRRGGQGAKSSSNVSAQVGVARDRRVGQKPRDTEGRTPSMPVVIHKKSRRSSLPSALQPGRPRDEDEPS
jgi:23S rRNA pseudouridine2605 synthase